LDKIIRRIRDTVETKAKQKAAGTEATKDDLADAARELGLSEFINLRKRLWTLRAKAHYWGLNTSWLALVSPETQRTPKEECS
jgi:hypothetical protein